MSAYKDHVLENLKGQLIIPKEQRKSLKALTSDDVLADFSMSRPNVKWGIAMEQDVTHTIYVWFDALNG